MASEFSPNHWHNKIRLQHLNVLIAIDKHNNIVKAAEESYLTQPAVTRILKDLEAQMGLELFTRTNRGVTATQYGKVLIKHAKTVIAQFKMANAELNALKQGFYGTIKVGTFVTAASHILPNALVAFQKERPHVIVDIVEGTNDRLLPALHTGEIDLIVGRLPNILDQKELRQEKLTDEIVHICVHPDHALAKKNHVTLKELLEWDWILPPESTYLRSELDNLFYKNGLAPPQAHVKSVSLLTNKVLVQQTNMVSIWPSGAIQHEITEGKVVAVNCEQILTLGAVGVIIKKDSCTPIVSAFLKHLKAIVV